MKILSVCVSLLLGLAAGISPANAASKLEERFSWRSLDWAFPTDAARQQAIRSGDFIAENALPVGIEIWGDKLFVTVPRWRGGIPSALNYISLSTAHTEAPQLTPYPDWNTNREGNCNGVTTTYRIKADACNRLWVLDTGTVGIGNTTEQVCPYALLAFDLTTDKLIRRYQLRPDDTNESTFIANIAVDIGNSCEDTYVYASDELGYGLIVYSWEMNTSWRVTHSYFMPDPLKGDYNIAGLNFQWGEEGIFGMSLSPIQNDGFRTLFFHPLSSHREFAVSTRILRDKDLALDSYHEFVVLEERGPNTHLTASFMDDEGIMYYNLIDQNAVGCWNSKNPYLPQYQGVIDKDDVGLVFPSDVKIDAARNIWVMSDRMPVFLEAELDFNDINFRIYVAPVDQALAGTGCESTANLRQGPLSHLALHASQAADLSRNHLEALSIAPHPAGLSATLPSRVLTSFPTTISHGQLFVSQPRQKLTYVPVQSSTAKLLSQPGQASPSHSTVYSAPTISPAYSAPTHSSEYSAPSHSGAYSFQTTHFGSKKNLPGQQQTTSLQSYWGSV